MRSPLRAVASAAESDVSTVASMPASRRMRAVRVFSSLLARCRSRNRLAPLDRPQPSVSHRAQSPASEKLEYESREYVVLMPISSPEASIWSGLALTWKGSLRLLASTLSLRFSSSTRTRAKSCGMNLDDNSVIDRRIPALCDDWIRRANQGTSLVRPYASWR